MAATRDGKYPETVREGGGAARRRLAIEIGMLAFLVGLALVFVAGAPS
jgi:hypothetical protein